MYAVGRVSLAFGEGLVGLAASRAEPVYAPDATNDPRARLFPETGEDRFQTLLAAPLRVGQVVAGVLVVQTLESREFADADVALLNLKSANPASAPVPTMKTFLF